MRRSTTSTLFARRYLAALGSTLVLSACAGGNNGNTLNVKPAYLGAVTSTTYDGVADDLLTAGLGKTRLGGAAPSVVDPLNPTVAELRRLAIFNNYRAILDISPGGGYGSLYGPNVDIDGRITTSEGMIPGTEYLAYSDDGTGTQNVTMMVQIPASFNPASPCIITGTSSGSRSVYGAIGSSGEWGLKHGCAVAYTDKGTGNGIHDLQNNTVSLQNGVRSDAIVSASNSNFTAQLTEPERLAFNQATPNRFAVKHAHSQQNPEKDWGKWTLQSIEFAFYVLNERFGTLTTNGTAHFQTIVPGNTIVIASSVSNGAGAALAAAEQDVKGLISGIAVAEPHVQLAPNQNLTVVRGNTSLVGSGLPLYNYFTLANLLQPCAALVSPATNVFNTVNPVIAAARCAALKSNGLITGNTTAEQAASALNGLLTAGWQPESNELQAAMFSFATRPIAMTYSNTYGRFSVRDNLCGFSYSGLTTGLATSFGTGNGIPPTAGVVIFNNNSVGGPVAEAASISQSTLAQDYAFDGALCQRELAIGSSPNALRVQSGIREAFRTADLKGKPALIVAGRSDALIPVAFASRPYFGVNQIVEGNNSKLSYIEIVNGQHFDAFLNFPGFGARYVPVHRYFIQALDLMYANLKSGTALPPSQVMRTTPRGVTGTAVNPISVANVPPIPLIPRSEDRITFANNTVVIPD